jgi:serine/threonine protein kinase
MAMQRLRGKTLRSVLDEAKTLPIERVLQLGHEIADGLAAIHDAGAVHRDIKPANVFVEDDGHAVIADLGLSRLLEPRTEISLPGTFLGSIAYAAPEQLEGFDVGPEADLYALGVLLYEMASGKNPFPRRRPEDDDARAREPRRAAVVAHRARRDVPLGARGLGSAREETRVPVEARAPRRRHPDRTRALRVVAPIRRRGRPASSGCPRRAVN